MGNNSEKSVDGEIHMMDIARFGSSIAKPKRMLALAALLLSMAAFPIQQAHAMANFTETFDSEWADISRFDTCGNCHFSWSGADTRGNFAMDYWYYDMDTMDSGMATALRTIDSDLDGVDNATELDNGQVGLVPAPMINYPDKDGDGYIMLYYRTDNTGLPVDNDGLIGSAPPVPPLGWDIDDNDAGQGNQTWGTDTPASTTDTTPPNAVTDLRTGALAAATINLQWSASGDDGATGTAHMNDIRYTTEAIVSGKGYQVRTPADWATMWDIADTDIDESSGHTLSKTGIVATAATTWNDGALAPLMRAVHEPVPLAAGSPSSYTLTQAGLNAAGHGYMNVLVDGTTYWLALQVYDGVLTPDSAGFTTAPTTFTENSSGPSNIVAITAGASGTGIQTIGTITGSNSGDTAGVVITGVGLNNIDGVQLVDVTGTPVTVGDSITTTGSTSITVTLGTTGVSTGFYTLEVTSGGTAKAAWVDAFEVTSGGGDTTPPGEVTGFSVTDATTGGQLDLSWTNPGDGDFAGVEISRAQGSTPADCSSPVASLGVVTSWNDTTVTDDLSYTYRICTRDAQPNYSTGMTGSGTPTTAADTTPPGEVTGFSVTDATSGNQLNLSWSNPGDGDFAGVEISRAQGSTPADCSSPVASLGVVTSWNDTTVTDGLSYTYRICTRDAVPNYSTGVFNSATPGDTVAPANVTGLSVTNAFVAGGQIDLSWTNPGDADFAGVAISRATGAPPADCSSTVQVVAAPGTSWNDTGVTVDTEYFYRVCAQDEVPNNSNGLTGNATPTEPDLTPPAEVTGFSVTDATTGGQLNLSWTNPGDGDFAGVEISRAQGSTPADCSSPVASLGVVTSWNDTTVTDGLSYTYRICTRDAVPNYSTGVFASATPTDSTAPGEVTGLSVSSIATGNRLDLSWANPGDGDFAGVEISRAQGSTPADCSSPVASLGVVTSWSDTTVTDGLSYTYRICTRDAVPNYSTGVFNSATPGDTVAPANVTGLSVTNAFVAGGQLDLSWTNPGDADFAGVAISRATGAPPADCSSTVQVVAAPGTSWNDVGVTVDTQYFYRVCAQDEVPNDSNGLTGNATPTEPDVTAPGDVTGFNVSINAAGNRLDLSWTNPGDGDFAGVTIGRDVGASFPSDCSAPVATLGVVTSWSDTGLTDGTTYNYRICSRDAVPNYSGGATGSNVPADSAAPANVTGFSINNPGSGGQLNLSWSNPGDTDLTAVYISRATGASAPADCSAPVATLGVVTSWSDTTLTDDQQYSYRICTEDEVPNTSGGITNSGTPTTGVVGEMSPAFAAGWQMIGVPTDLIVDNTFNGLFADEIGSTPYSYNWYSTGAASSWAGGYGYSTTATPGLGYFFYIPVGGTQLIDSSNGTNGSANVDVTLQAGGNMITNPYLVSKDITNGAQAAFCNATLTPSCTGGDWVTYGTAIGNGWVLNTIYRYNGVSYDAQTNPSGTLVPWYGYWLRVDTANTIKMRIYQ